MNLIYSVAVCDQTVEQFGLAPSLMILRKLNTEHATFRSDELM